MLAGHVMGRFASTFPFEIRVERHHVRCGEQAPFINRHVGHFPMKRALGRAVVCVSDAKRVSAARLCSRNVPLDSEPLSPLCGFMAERLGLTTLRDLFTAADHGKTPDCRLCWNSKRQDSHGSPRLFTTVLAHGPKPPTPGLS
jgi:hypothetical protein